jgi:4-hydroxy-3-polyprenylbenzoate decarboxylase
MSSEVSRQSLRATLGALEERGELRRLVAPVDPRFEISACLEADPGGPALLFESVVGGALPVVGNVLNSRRRMADALGVGLGELQERIVEAISRPVAPREVADGPCHEVVIDAPDLLGELPLPWFFEHETGPYVTAGAIVARDPVTGAGNLSIARLKPLDGNRALIGIAPNHHLAVMARVAAERRVKLPLAVAIGVHPGVLIAACLYLGYGEDELGCAGRLLGQPVELVAGAQPGLVAPAQAEVVLEATLDPEERVIEGPVSEYHGMYEDYGAGYVVTVDRLTRRRDALLHVVQPGHNPEHIFLGAVAIAAGLLRALRPSFPFVRAVALPPGGSGRLSVVVSVDVDLLRPGSVRRVMLAVWAALSIVRWVTVVGEDVDPWDEEQVEWARMCFVRGDADLLVVSGLSADRSDPLKEGAGTVAKLGVDATPKRVEGLGSLRARVPAEAVEAARRVLSEDRGGGKE